MAAILFKKIRHSIDCQETVSNLKPKHGVVLCPCARVLVLAQVPCISGLYIFVLVINTTEHVHLIRS